MTLVFSSRAEVDDVGAGVLDWWREIYPNFSYERVHTRADDGSSQPDARIPAVLGELFPSLAATSVFIAGSDDFVHDCLLAARRLGAEEHLIHTEGHIEQPSPEGRDELVES